MTNDDALSIAHDAEWLVHRFDPARDAFHLVRAPRAALGKALFLTDEFLPEKPPFRILTREQVFHADPPTAPIHYIFHSAFCCSTLLARALDRPGLAMGLKEPVVLNDLVGWRRRGGTDADVLAALGAALTLLARPFGPGEAIVVKPSNIAACISSAMLATRPQSRAILLHTPLRAYVGSIARKGLWGRLWVRDLFVGLHQDRLIDLGIAEAEYIKLTDLQIAAVGWLAQHALFAGLLDRYGPARARSLQSEVLIARPVATMEALFDLFGWADRAAIIPGIVADGGFGQHSKSAQPFGATERAAEQQEAADRHADEIDKVVVWAEAVARNAGISLELAHPLL